MSVDINNAQFRAFTDFARGVEAGAAVKIGGTTLNGPDGLSRSIEAKKGDFFGNVFRGKPSADENRLAREVFRSTVLQMFGVADESKLPEKVKTAMKLDDFDGKGKPLTARRILAVRDAIVSADKEMRMNPLCLSGKGTGIIKNLVKGSGILDSDNPADEFKRRMLDTVKAELTTHMAQQMGKQLFARVAPGSSQIAKPVRVDLNSLETTFDKDMVRGTPITLNPGGIAVPHDARQARDLYTRFITGDDTATFSGADDALKRKVHMLMACTNQGFVGSVMAGAATALDPSGRTEMITGIGNQAAGGGQVEAYSVSKDAHGNITVTQNLRFNAPIIPLNTLGGESMTLYTNAKSHMDLSITASISATEMERVANLPWKDLEFDSDTLPNTDHPHKERANSLPEEFKVDFDIQDAAFSVHIDEAATSFSELMGE